MIINENGYNKTQLNSTTNFSPDGKILSKSLMLNLRGETPEEVWRAYQELKGLIDGVNEKSEKKVRKNPGNRMQNKKRNADSCPQCGGLLVEKQGISKKTGRPYHFFGCGNFPSCNFTKPVEEEMIDVNEIPF